MVLFTRVSTALLICMAAGVSGQALHSRTTSAPPPESQPANPSTSPIASGFMVPQGTSLQIETAREYPMKDGEAIEGRLIHPLYVNGSLAVPAGTAVRGKVTGLTADSKTRWDGRLHGDFTPFHTPQVEFDELELSGGTVALDTKGAVTGAPVLRLAAPGARPHQSFAGRQWSMVKSRIHEQVAFITDPGLGGRARNMLYRQLPYHPEHIPAHTAWTVELSAPVTLPGLPEKTAAPEPPPVAGQPEVWMVNAELSEHLTSATAKPGDVISALVVEPVFDKERQVVVPQGSMLIGKVTIAKSARSLGRNGKLRFTFQQVRFPEGSAMAQPNREVQGALSGVTAESKVGLNMDAEGTVSPKNQSSVIAPLLLTMLAGRALDEDGDLTAQAGVASNGFGLVGRVVGMAAGSRNLAAGLGFYAAGLSFYENFLTPGRDVDFPKDTRIEIETTPLRAPVLKPDSQ